MNADDTIHRRLAGRVRAAARICVSLTAGIGLLGLVGWAGDIIPLKRVYPDATPMNPTVAVLFMVLAVSCLVIDHGVPRWLILGRLGAALVFAAAAYCLAGYLLNFEPGIDRVLFRGELGGNRMAPNTSIIFMFAAAATLALPRTDDLDDALASQVLALFGTCIALLALLGYAYRVTTFYGVGNYTPMALNSATAFVLFGAGLLQLHPTQGFMRRLVSSGADGAIVRRLLPAAVLIPPVLGWLRLAAKSRAFTSGFRARHSWS